MITAGDERETKPYFWRLQYVIPAVAVLVAASGVAVAYARSTGRSEPTTATTGPTTTARQDAPVAATAGASPVGDTMALWSELPPQGREPCRVPPSASGAAWQAVPTRLGPTAVTTGLVCNLMAGGEGSLDFELGRQYEELTMTVGFAADSPSTGARVRFEVIGDGRVYLADPVPTLTFGQTAPVRVDVRGTTRLRLRVEEVGGGSTGKPARPVFGDPVPRAP